MLKQKELAMKSKKTMTMTIKVSAGFLIGSLEDAGFKVDEEKLYAMMDSKKFQDYLADDLLTAWGELNSQPGAGDALESVFDGCLIDEYDYEGDDE
jgi:hypothetical protein